MGHRELAYQSSFTLNKNTKILNNANVLNSMPFLRVDGESNRLPWHDNILACRSNSSFYIALWSHKLMHLAHIIAVIFCYFMNFDYWKM